jgi:mRNA interferase RelE/StbE
VSAPWTVVATRSANHDLKQLDPQVRKRVKDRLAELATSPHDCAGVRQLKGRPQARLRVGDWRVIFETNVKRHEVVVHRVGHRRDVYRSP